MNENLKEGIVLLVEVNKEKEILFTNKKFRDILNYKKEDLLGEKYKKVLDKNIPYGLYEQAFILANKGIIWFGYFKIVTKEGYSFWTETYVQPKLDKDNNLISFLIKQSEPRESDIKELEEEIKNNTNENFKSINCGEL